jgi:hypothetical protein
MQYLIKYFKVQSLIFSRISRNLVKKLVRSIPKSFVNANDITKLGSDLTLSADKTQKSSFHSPFSYFTSKAK